MPKDVKRKEVVVPIVGTAPLLIGHPLPWDIGGAYWQDQPPEVGNSKLKVPPAEDQALLKRLGIKYTPGEQLSTEAEVYMRGYWLPDGMPAYPQSGFMNAILTGAKTYQGRGKDRISAKKISAALRVLGDPADPNLVQIRGTITTDVCMGRNSGMNAAPRIVTRLKIPTGWAAKLRISYLPALINVAQIAQLVRWSGDFGIGQWRPSAPKGGTYGTYQLAVE